MVTTLRGLAVVGLLAALSLVPNPAVAAGDDRLLIHRAPDSGAPGIYTVDTDGSNLTFLAPGHDPAWSPDGRRIAFTKTIGSGDQIFVMDTDGTDELQLTATSGTNRLPAWSPDGSRIAFTSTRDGQEEIYVVNADGSGETRLTTNPGPDSEPTWSPDGATLAFSSQRARTLTDIHVMNADGSGVAPLTSSGAGNRDPAFSPDGGKIAFASFRFGSANAFELMVMNPDGSGQTRLTTNAGNDDGPEWSPDGTRIAFASRRDPEVITNKTSIVVINSDGTGAVQLTFAGRDTSISWRTPPTCILTGDGDTDESGPISSVVHDSVEPAAGALGPTVHEVNCTLIAPQGL